jgi:hypothetical protein
MLKIIERIQKYIKDIEEETDVDDKNKNTLINILMELDGLKKELDVSTTPFNVPEGYLWCEYCNALTPHDDGHYSWSKECVICGNSTSIDLDECPNCAWSPPEDISPEYEEIIHGDGCHCQIDFSDSFEIYNDAQKVLKDFPDNILNFNVENRLNELNLLECSCKRVIIISTTNIYNYKSYPVWSDACSNAIEWSYDVRCPICGQVYEVSDGNC